MASSPFWSRKAALLLLLSVGTQQSAASNSQQRQLVPSDRQLGGGRSTKVGKAATTATHPHHHGGGKHDAGTDGHHPKKDTKTSSKSAKAVASSPATVSSASVDENKHSAKTSKATTLSPTATPIESTPAIDPDVPHTRCHISDGTSGASMLLTDLDPDAASKDYACVAMCYDCGSSHMSAIDFCSTEQQEGGDHLSVHLAVLKESVEVMMSEFEDVSTGFHHCMYDDCNVDDACIVEEEEEEEVEDVEVSGKAAKATGVEEMEVSGKAAKATGVEEVEVSGKAAKATGVEEVEVSGKATKAIGVEEVEVSGKAAKATGVEEVDVPGKAAKASEGEGIANAKAGKVEDVMGDDDHTTTAHTAVASESKAGKTTTSNAKVEELTPPKTKAGKTTHVDDMHATDYEHSTGSGKTGKTTTDTKTAKATVMADHDHNMSYSGKDAKSIKGDMDAKSGKGDIDAKSGKGDMDAKSGKGDMDAKSGKTTVSYDDDDYDNDMSYSHDGAKSGKVYASSDMKGSNLKPKGGKSLTHYFIKESTYDHEHHKISKSAKSFDDSWWGGPWSSKAASDDSTHKGGDSKSAKSEHHPEDDHTPGDDGMGNHTMSETTTVATELPPSDGDPATTMAPVSAPSMPNVLLTMSPTDPPQQTSSAQTPPPTDPMGIVDAIPLPGEDFVGRWWFKADQSGTLRCEYTYDYPEGEETYDTREECCAISPGGCPTDESVIVRTDLLPTMWWVRMSLDGVPSYCEYSDDYPLAYLADDEGRQNLFDDEDACIASIPVKSPPAEFSRFERPGQEKENNNEPTQTPTWYPTMDADGDVDAGFQEPMLAQVVEDVQQELVLQPFGLKLFTSNAEPNYDEEVVKRVTTEHLIHSFRTNPDPNWEVNKLELLVLEKERHLMHAPNSAATSPMTLRWLATHPVHELILGGVLYFSEGAATPSDTEMYRIVEESFEAERLDYYIELLQEAGMDIDRAKLDDNLEPPIEGDKNVNLEGDGFNVWRLMIGLSSAIGGIGLLALGKKQLDKKRDRQLMIDDLNVDVENGDYKDYAIRLQYTNDEIEPPDATVAMTSTHSEDHLSVPSLMRGGEEDEIVFAPTPGGTNLNSVGSMGSNSVSPLESPQDVSPRTPSSPQTSTRYVSVFTVKKDCGGKALHEVDLRALAIAYLSRMLKKFPNTHLLPYDKNAPLPAITNIRNIPDDMEELQQYVGNARLDDRTGKVLFNLRVESDDPVSKMKNSSGSVGSRGLKKKYKSSSSVKSQESTPVVIAANTSVKSMDEMEQAEMPRTPGEFSDVTL